MSGSDGIMLINDERRGMIEVMKGIHGGDIYRNHVKIDFSVNINPLGIPKAVKDALYQAIENSDKYPDITAQKLAKAVSESGNVEQEYLLFGNGASELFMAIVHGIRPKKTVIPIPSFYGYEYAAGAAGGEIIYYKTQKENGFYLEEEFLSVLTGDVDLLFLANPNNPTGCLIDRNYLHNLLLYCKEKGIYVVLDECFIEFCGEEAWVMQEIGQYENLLLVRAFTKIYAIPGVRLGYLVCSNDALREKIRRQLPEWNLSCFAQAAGYECIRQKGFIEKTAEYIKQERLFLQEGLEQLGLKVFPSKANFLLIQSEADLYERLLEKGILIRDCGNFRGLLKGFYRIAVKSREENEMLLRVMGAINGKNREGNQNRTFTSEGD